MVQFKERFVSGHRFSDADNRSRTSGFKPLAACTAPAAEAGLKAGTESARLKACPDTNLFQAEPLPKYEGSLRRLSASHPSAKSAEGWGTLVSCGPKTQRAEAPCSFIPFVRRSWVRCWRRVWRG